MHSDPAPADRLDDHSADQPADRPADRPIVRLRPKGPAQAIRFGAPWAYADQIVLDRRTRAIAPGAVVVLEDDERRPLGAAAFNPASKIAVRMLDRDPAAAVDEDWFASRIARALELRERLFDAPFYRLIHAEADGLPGVVVDRYGDAAVVQPNAAWAEARIDAFVLALRRVTGVSAVVKNGLGRARGLEGLASEVAVIAGAVEAPVAVTMNGATYLADLLGGQKTGIYYDQRPNHAFAARLARGADVLDVFAHVGGFGLAALAGGAASALAVDGSAPALAFAEQGAAAAGVVERFAVRRGDAFEAMAALGAEGRRFGLVVADPPAFAPAKPALEAGLRAYERVARLASPLVGPGGFLVLCSCSHAADLARFREASLRGIGRAGRSAQIVHTGAAGPDHPVHPHLAETAYLKALFLRLD
jgi:23S rRNA (cytosine1962-C5)-methyltransferase